MPVQIANSKEGIRLLELSKLEKMLDDSYLSDFTNPQTLFILQQFFNGDKFSRLDPKIDNRTARNTNLSNAQKAILLNISYGLPNLVAEILGNYVGTPENTLDVDLFDFVYSFSWAGYSVMKLRKLDTEFEIEYGAPEGYIKMDDRKTEKLLTFFDERDSKNEIIKYIFEQTYTPGLIENKLYRFVNNKQTKDFSINGEPVSLNTIEATRDIKESESTGLEVNPLVVTNNVFTTNRKYGTADPKKFRSILSSIEIQLVNIQDQFLKHLQAKLAIPASKLPTDPKTGLVDVRNLEVIGMEVGDTIPTYITNSNPLIEQSFLEIDMLIRQLAAILSIPIEFFNLKSVGGVESGEAKSIRISNFLKRVGRVRRKFSKAINEAEQIAIEWGTIKKEDVTPLVWDDIFPIDKKQEVDELSVAQDARLISHKRAVMRYQDLTDEEAEAEVKIINEENASIGVDDLGV